jgi:hypothetical protein
MIVMILMQHMKTSTYHFNWVQTTTIGDIKINYIIK